MGALNYSVDTEHHPISKLKQIMLEQQEELVNLCTIVEYLRGFLYGEIDASDTAKYEEKLSQFKELQQQRFQCIDGLINKNILQMKKNQTDDKTVLVFGKEIRKLEAGLRTLMLFTADAVDMLKQGSTLNNRSEERIRYFDIRSAAIDVENRLLLQKMTFI
ncbi:MAG: chemotaxis protein [Solibacillus sp.]